MDALHPAVVEALRFFEYEHLPEHLQEISRPFYDLAYQMATRVQGPQLTNGLQRLLEAKDCMVRAALPKLPRATGGVVKDGELYIVGDGDGCIRPGPGFDA